MNIINYPNDILNKKSEPIAKVDDELKAFAQEMLKVMDEANGLGLSAPQVGRLIRLIVIKPGLIMFNPTILKASAQKNNTAEGCLSFKDETVNITRSNNIDVKYRDENNKVQYIKLSGMQARAVQHEIDHLKGITLADYGLKSSYFSIDKEKYLDFKEKV